MPAPRLELRWQPISEKHERRYTCECLYSLVLKLYLWDIRAECDDGATRLTELKCELGKTLSDGTPDSHYHRQSDTIRSPFRDGAHSRWDGAQLGKLPIYVVAAGRAQLLEYNEDKP